MWDILKMFLLLTVSGVTGGTVVVWVFVKQLKHAIDEMVDDALKQITDEGDK